MIKHLAVEEATVSATAEPVFYRNMGHSYRSHICEMAAAGYDRNLQCSCQEKLASWLGEIDMHNRTYPWSCIAK